MRHTSVVLATQIQETIFNTIHQQKTGINHTTGLCVEAANEEHSVELVELPLATAPFRWLQRVHGTVCH